MFFLCVYTLKLSKKMHFFVNTNNDHICYNIYTEREKAMLDFSGSVLGSASLLLL